MSIRIYNVNSVKVNGKEREDVLNYLVDLNAGMYLREDTEVDLWDQIAKFHDWDSLEVQFEDDFGENKNIYTREDDYEFVEIDEFWNKAFNMAKDYIEEE